MLGKEVIFGGLLACALLAGCGGGGDGGGGGTTANVGLANVRLPTFPDELFENGSRQSQSQMLPDLEISADLTGDIGSLKGKPIFVVVEDPDQFIENAAVLLPLTTVRNVVKLFPKRSGLAKGRYVNRLRVFVCLDPQCQSQFGGSPIVMPYDLTVYRGLVINGNADVELSAMANTAARFRVPFTVPEGLLYEESDPSVPQLEIPQLSSASFEPTAVKIDSPAELLIRLIPQPANQLNENLVVYAQVKTPKGKTYRLEGQVPLRVTIKP